MLMACGRTAREFSCSRGYQPQRSIKQTNQTVKQGQLCWSPKQFGSSKRFRLGEVAGLFPIHHSLKMRLPFSLRIPQRNRNELGETTVNKTWQKYLPPQEKSTT
jgi:hypothetical protein